MPWECARNSSYDAVVEAAVSRLRPVVLAAATTVLGVIPLLPDVFWVAMARAFARHCGGDAAWCSPMAFTNGADRERRNSRCI